MSILKVLDRLATTPSKNEKLAILTEAQHNITLRTAFQLAYTTQIRFWIKKRPATIYVGLEMPLHTALENLRYVIGGRQLTGNDAITYIGKLLGQLSSDDREVFYRVLDRDLKCGTGTSIANKVWKDLILDYPILLCDKFNEKTEKKLKWAEGVIVQTKMDSSRLNFEFDKGELISISTRNGNLIDITPFVKVTSSDLNHYILDGELMYSVDGIDIDRKTASGIINKAIKGTISPEESFGLNLVCWDYIPHEDFIRRECSIPYSERFEMVQDALDENCTITRLVESTIVYSKEDALDIYKKNRSRGLEGVIIKNPNAIWTSRRSSDYLKMKAEETCELLVVDVEYGTVGSKYEGMLGALVCETNCGKLRVNVGTGFSDEQRMNPKDYLDKIVEVKYNEVISKKTSDVKSLFLPVFVDVRFDKDIANTLKELV